MQLLANAFATAYLADREARTLSTVTRLTKVLQDQATALDKRRAALDKQIAAATTSTVRATLGAQRSLALNEQLAVRSRLVEARTVDTTPGDIVGTAAVPHTRSGPPTRTLVALGLLLGLAAGVGAAWLLALLRPSLRGAAGRACRSVPVLATLPERSTGRRACWGQIGPPGPSIAGRALAIGVVHGDVVAGGRVLMVAATRERRWQRRSRPSWPRPWP